jgi:transposase
MVVDALMELHDARPAKLPGDKGYDSDEIRNALAKRGIKPVIPLRSNRTTPIEYDREACKRRNLIERCVNRLEQFRRTATRYEKTARAFISMLCIASARRWIKTVNAAQRQSQTVCRVNIVVSKPPPLPDVQDTLPIPNVVDSKCNGSGDRINQQLAEL